MRDSRTGRWQETQRESGPQVAGDVTGWAAGKQSNCRRSRSPQHSASGMCDLVA